MSQSVGRALQILTQLGQGPASLDELAQAVGVHKTTVLRLLRTLADDRFVFRDGSHRYHLGSRIFELSSRALDQREVRRIAASHLAAFNRQHGRTTHLAVLEDGEVIYIDKLESHDQIRMYSRIGLRAPLHSSAVAKVLLADLPDAEVRHLLDGVELLPATPNTITDRDVLMAELAVVREQGWAHDREENEPSINCIAGPVRGASGRVLAAVSVSVPDVVLTYERLLELLPALLDCTEKISRDCGWEPPGRSLTTTTSKGSTS
jgi:DNA-binding IclR family transcriptional regulator